jgi:hypothetical protein
MSPPVERTLLIEGLFVARCVLPALQVDAAAKLDAILSR